MGKSSESLLLMLDDLNLDKPTQNYDIRKVMNIAIRCTYYIFCRRNKPGTILIYWTFDLFNIYICPFLFKDTIVFFKMVFDIFFFGIYVNSLLVLQNFTTARKSGNIILTYRKLFSSDTHQSIKRRIVTDRLTETYTQMQLHVIGCV